MVFSGHHPRIIMLVKLLFLFAIPALCQGFVLDTLLGRNQSVWNGLKVTWGINPFNSFNSMPRTKAAAERAGWQNMNPGVGCSAHGNFLGERYWKDNDMAVILIYDPAGFIAGIQAGVSNNYSPNPNNYPFNKLKTRPFVLDGSNYYVTAYFVDPASLCSGRSDADFKAQGTGTGLWIQNGTNPTRDSVKIPHLQSDADKSEWTKGACFISMGMHYWYQLKKDMVCDNLFPVFLLYNDGVLNAFGWAFAMEITTSSRLEHPTQSSYSSFMAPPPDCLFTLGTMSTLHIYLTDRATADTC